MTGERLKFWATIKKDGVPLAGLEKVTCQVLLPKKASGTISVSLLPIREQAKLLEHLLEISFSGELQLANGTVTGTIESKKALLTESKYRFWDSDLAEIKCRVQVEDLTITHFRDRQGSDNSDRVQARFWLTPNRMLSDKYMIEHHYTKGMSAKGRKTLIQAKLANGMRLEFKEYFRFQKVGSETLVYRELVGEYDLFRRRKGIRAIDETVIRQIDDLLVLISFASRQRCVMRWLGFCGLQRVYEELS